MKKFLLNLLVLVMVLVGMAGCISASAGGDDGEDKEGVYATQLKKVIDDAKDYVGVSKKAAERYVLEDGIYLIMEENMSKVLYAYSVSDLAGLTADEETELYSRVEAAVEDGVVYVVYSDNSKELLDYISIIDTAQAGYSPSIDASMAVENTGGTAGNRNAKAIVDEIPSETVTVSQFTIFLKEPFVDNYGTGIKGDRVELVKANSVPELVYAGLITEVSSDGISAKVTMMDLLEAGTLYKPRSVSGSKIYFGSNIVAVPGENDELYVKSVESVANGEFTVAMNRAESNLNVSDFTVVEILGNGAKYASSLKIKDIDANMVTFSTTPVEQADSTQVLTYKISYKKTSQVSTGKVIIPGLGAPKSIVNLQAENGEVTIELTEEATMDDLESILLEEYINSTNTKTISLAESNTVIDGNKITATVPEVSKTDVEQIVNYRAKYNDTTEVSSNKFVIEKEYVFEILNVEAENGAVSITMNDEVSEGDLADIVLNEYIDNVKGDAVTLDSSNATIAGNEISVDLPAVTQGEADKKVYYVAQYKETSTVKSNEFVVSGSGATTDKKLEISDAEVNEGDYVDVYVSASNFTETDVTGFNVVLEFDETLLAIEKPNTDIEFLNGFDALLTIKNVENGEANVATTIETGKDIAGNIIKIRFKALEVDADADTSIKFKYVQVGREDFVSIDDIVSSDTGDITIKDEEIITNDPKLLLTSTTTTVNEGDTFEVTISGENFDETDIAAFDIYLAYDESIFDVANVETDVEILEGYTSSFSLVQKTEGEATNNGNLVITSPFGEDGGTVKGINANLVTVTFTAKEAGTSDVAFGKVNIIDEDMNDIVGYETSSKVSVEVNGTGADDATILISDDTTGNLDIGDEFEVVVSGAGFGEQGNGIQAYLTYDSSIIEVATPDDKISSVTMHGNFATDGMFLPIDQEADKVKILNSTGKLEDFNQDLFTIKFVAKAEGNANIAVELFKIADSTNDKYLELDTTDTGNFKIGNSGPIEEAALNISDANVEAGDEFEIMVSGSDFAELGNGIEITLAYNSSIIEVATPDNKLDSVTMYGNFATDGTLLDVDQETGKIKIVNSTGSGENFNQDLFSVKFVAKSSGTANITVEDLLIADEANENAVTVKTDDKGVVEVAGTPVTLDSINITGGSEVNVEDTLQLTATATYSDGSTQDVTSEATWTSSSDAATVSTGTVTGSTEGTSSITATYEGKEESVTISVVDNSFDGTILYVKADTAPSIWAWETDGVAITDEMGYTWNDQPTMETVSDTEMNDPSGWFKLEIAAEYLTGENIVMILNQGSEIERGSGNTGWYDDGTWSDADPTTPVGPTKPSVSISPAGGTKKGTETITITIDGDDITSEEATFAGSTVSLTLPTTTITLSDYITTDKGTGTLNVSATNSEGTTTKTADFTRDDNPVVVEGEFTWDNANIYFVMTDRFYNGDTSNDHSYGRRNDYSGDNAVIGTFHGGDIKGMTDKIDYLDEIGVNAIWLTGPFEQMHGWVGGAEDGNFPHYGYHGYYTMDHTMIDKNMGTVEEFRTLVTEAHSRGIRVILDIVLNHPGYASIFDMIEYGFGGVDKSMEEARALTYNTGGWHGFHDYIDYENASAWTGFWGKDWVRIGVPGYDFEGTSQEDEIKGTLDNLPDFKTDSTQSTGLPPLLQTKWSQEGSSYDAWRIPTANSLRTDLGVAPADYVVKWLAAWVEEFGIDGFRADTTKHVDIHRWKELKDASNIALANWRNSDRSNGDPAKDWDEDFWMTGEHWNWPSAGSHPQGDYFSNGFDSMIDFGYKGSVPLDASSMGGKWSAYAEYGGQHLPYISSHDTGAVFYNGETNRQISAGTALLLNPGPVQTYYGDEIGRENGANGGDPNQGSRSAFQWDKVGNDINEHWSKIGTFRKNNPAVGAGTQTDLGEDTYGRVWNDNKVVIKVGANGSTSVNVSGIFNDGDQVRNAYNGEEGTVSGGTVTFTGENGVILVEAM